LEVGCSQTAADFKPEQPLMLTQALQGQAVASAKKKTMSELAREWGSAVEEKVHLTEQLACILAAQKHVASQGDDARARTNDV
jgi:hypothetical protein